MEDKFLESYKKTVYTKLNENQKGVLPLTWWDSVINYYYRMGYTEERTVQVILETMNKK